MSSYSGRDPGITIVRLSLVLTGFLMILLLASPVTASAVPGLKDPIQLVNTGFAFGSSVALGAGLGLVGAKVSPLSSMLIQVVYCLQLAAFNRDLVSGLSLLVTDS